MTAHRLTARTIDDEAALRAIIGEPTPLVASKVVDRLNRLTRRWIELSPLVCLATSDANGSCDVSPRGDPAGFVRILDDRTLLLPERPGNRIADSLRNILANPHVGLLFVVPGVTDTFRVDGRATITDDDELLAPSSVEGKPPKLGILVDVEHCYTQCGKAFLRSSFFDPARFVDRAALPTNGEIHALLSEGEIDATEYDEARAARYARREGFY
jgi:PPOX class probable FMN-dependent enzyme